MDSDQLVIALPNFAYMFGLADGGQLQPPGPFSTNTRGAHHGEHGELQPTPFARIPEGGSPLLGKKT